MNQLFENSERFPLNQYYYVIKGGDELTLNLGQLIGHGLNTNGEIIGLQIKFGVPIDGVIRFGTSIIPPLAVMRHE